MSDPLKIRALRLGGSGRNPCRRQKSRFLIRWPSALVLALGLAACDPPLGGPENPVGSSTLLAYAPPGTEIVLESTINNEISRSRLTAGDHRPPRGAYLAEDGSQRNFYPACWGCGDKQIDEAAYGTLWPLETGKFASFLRIAATGETARVIVRVAGKERLATPAGTFDTWILEGRVESETGPAYSAQVRAWWAPGPGWVVRARGGDSEGNAFSTEVLEFVFRRDIPFLD